MGVSVEIPHDDFISDVTGGALPLQPDRKPLGVRIKLAWPLGHRNAGVIHKHYARWIDGSDSRREATQVDRVFQKRA